MYRVRKSIKLLLIGILTMMMLGISSFYILIGLGVSPKLQTIWVTTAMTTLNHKWLATSFVPGKKISQIMKENYVDAKVGAVENAVNAQAVYNATNTATISCIQGQIAQLQGLTKVVIPIANVCPEPMAKYNSWTAPTAAA